MGRKGLGNVCAYEKEWAGALILNNKSEKFTIGKGFRQRDIIAPKLFKACLEGCLGGLMQLRVNGEYLSLSIFADGIVLR